jgi:hypothetical protein
VISNVEVPWPVEYKPTGDHALLVAWTHADGYEPGAVLCLEDGRAVAVGLRDIKFDYRYDLAKGEFVDVSKATASEAGEEEEGADTDQEAPDDGGPGVP